MLSWIVGSEYIILQNLEIGGTEGAVIWDHDIQSRVQMSNEENPDWGIDINSQDVFDFQGMVRIILLVKFEQQSSMVADPYRPHFEFYHLFH